MISAAFVNDEVDALDALAVTSRAPVIFKNGLRLPISRVDNISDALGVLEPPSVALIAVEVQADVSLGDA